MNDETSQSEKPAGESPEAVPVDGASARRLVNPNLSGSLTADYAALQNDLVQAQELAADFQRQLAGKSNEHAQLKQIFEKTQADLAHLQEGIVELRAERHRLANEAMRATAFQAKLDKVTAERDHLRSDMEILRQALAKKADEMTIALRDRDRHIAELVVEMVGLRQALKEARGEVSTPASVPSIKDAPLEMNPDFDCDVDEVEIVSSQIRK
jgi:chromosome segregation ATPase